MTLYCSNFVTAKVLQFMFFGFNFGIAWDMVKSMTNPFDSIEVRYKTILILSGITTFLAFISFLLFQIILGMATESRDDTP